MIEDVAGLRLGYIPHVIGAAKAPVLKERRAARGARVTDWPLQLMREGGLPP